MGAMLTTARVAKAMEECGDFYSTYGWHPRSVAAATATLDYFAAYGDVLFDNAIALGEHARTRLASMPFASRATVRGLGFAIAVELGSGREAKRLKDRCREEGVLISSAGEEVLQLFPALTIASRTLEEGLDVIQSCLGERHAKAA